MFKFFKHLTFLNALQRSFKQDFSHKLKLVSTLSLNNHSYYGSNWKFVNIRRALHLEVVFKVAPVLSPTAETRLKYYSRIL